MKEMCRRMMSLNHPSPRTIYFQDNFRGNNKIDRLSKFEVKGSPLLGDPLDRHHSMIWKNNLSGIADLSSHLGIERRTVHDDEGLLLLTDDLDQTGPLLHRAQNRQTPLA